MRLLRRLFALAIVTSVAGGPAVMLSAQGTDPFVGRWRLDPARSTLPGPAPELLIRIFEDRGDGVLLAWNEGTNAQGEPVGGRVAFKRDGRDYPLAYQGQQADFSMAYTAIDSNTVEVVVKRDGVVTTKGTETVSRDGRTYTFSGTTTNAEGETVTLIEVFARQ